MQADARARDSFRRATRWSSDRPLRGPRRSRAPRSRRRRARGTSAARPIAPGHIDAKARASADRLAARPRSTLRPRARAAASRISAVPCSSPPCNAQNPNEIALRAVPRLPASPAADRAPGYGEFVAPRRRDENRDQTLGLLLVLRVRRIRRDRPLPPRLALGARDLPHGCVERFGTVLDHDCRGSARTL